MQYPQVIVHASQKTVGLSRSSEASILYYNQNTTSQTTSSRQGCSAHRPESRVMGGHVALLAWPFLLQRTLSQVLNTV